MPQTIISYMVKTDGFELTSYTIDRVIFLPWLLPKLQRPSVRAFPDVGPSLSFPVGEVPFRHASQGQYASPPGGGAPGADPDDRADAYKGRPGIDSRWEQTCTSPKSATDAVRSSGPGRVRDRSCWSASRRSRVRDSNCQFDPFPISGTGLNNLAGSAPR